MGASFDSGRIAKAEVASAVVQLVLELIPCPASIASIAVTRTDDHDEPHVSCYPYSLPAEIDADALNKLETVAIALDGEINESASGRSKK